MSVEKSTTEVRQGETTGSVRWVLGISLTLVVLGLIAVAIFSV
jgi:hypothetical protein